jgi:hypothetical protein
VGRSAAVGDDESEPRPLVRWRVGRLLGRRVEFQPSSTSRRRWARLCPRWATRRRASSGWAGAQASVGRTTRWRRCAQLLGSKQLDAGRGSPRGCQRRRPSLARSAAARSVHTSRWASWSPRCFLSSWSARRVPPSSSATQHPAAESPETVGALRRRAAQMIGGDPEVLTGELLTLVVEPTAEAPPSPSAPRGTQHRHHAPPPAAVPHRGRLTRTDEEGGA